MAEIPPPAETHEPGGPTFEKIVIAAGILLMILLVFAWAFVHFAWHKVTPLPLNHPTALVLGISG
jgi:hypothetical protein